MCFQLECSKHGRVIAIQEKVVVWRACRVTVLCILAEDSRRVMVECGDHFVYLVLGSKTLHIQGEESTWMGSDLSFVYSVQVQHY